MNKTTVSVIDLNDLDHFSPARDRCVSDRARSKIASWLAGLGALLFLSFLTPTNVFAQNLRIVEVFVGTSSVGTPTDQYIVLQMI